MATKKPAKTQAEPRRRPQAGKVDQPGRTQQEERLATAATLLHPSSRLNPDFVPDSDDEEDED